MYTAGALIIQANSIKNDVNSVAADIDAKLGKVRFILDSALVDPKLIQVKQALI